VLDECLGAHRRHLAEVVGPSLDPDDVAALDRSLDRLRNV
jgi:hypothetical protein